MIISGKTWLWWSLWLALKPGLKSGHFEEFKQQLAERRKVVDRQEIELAIRDYD